jgi:hypothetical protein
MVIAHAGSGSCAGRLPEPRHEHVRYELRRQLAVRPEGANHLPGELSIRPEADKRLGRQLAGSEPRDKGHLGWLSDPAGGNACEA